MKEYEASNIRNLALIGHGSAGKTILAESMLACSGAITRIGSVEQGSTVSDYHDDEQQRQISIHTTSMYAEWDSCKLNILDSPGYADFVGEALSALRVADSAILTVHGAHGIELGTEQMWEKVCDMKMSTLVAVNVLDAEYVKFDQIVEEDGKRSDDTSSRLFHLKECLKKIDKENFKLLKMRYEQRLPFKEIATTCNKTSNALRIQAHRIRNQLMNCVEKRMRGELV